MRKLPNRKLLGAIIAGALLLPSQAFTLGLGEIEVSSALNQKLKADIELLSATPEDTESIIVKLASRDQFQRAGLDRPYSLNDLSFKAEVIDGAPYVIVSSSSPIREPYLNFLLEVDWPNGHLVREYTILLDPPVFMMQSAGSAATSANQVPTSAADNSFRPSPNAVTNTAPVAAPTAVVNPRPTTSQLQAPSDSMNQASATSTFVPAPVQQQAVIKQPTGAYRIKAGDTAWSLANAMRPDQSVSVEQMMIAMLRSNPGAFINDNINGLKRGYILRVPDYNQISSVNQSDARAVVREQAALWKQYQQTQSGGQPVSAMEAGDGAAASGAAGSDAKKTDDAYLEIVSAGSGASTISGKDPTAMTAKELRAELALARERVETERVEKEALQGRVENLEQHVDKMKGMLAIEDKELAEVQSLNMPADVESDEMLEDENLQDEDLQNALAEAATEMTDAETAELVDDAEIAGAETLDAAESEMMEQDVAVEDLPVEDALAGSDEVVFTDESDAEPLGENLTDESMAEMPEQIDTATENFDAVAPLDRMPEPVGLLDKLLNNPVVLAAGAGGLLLITGLIGFIFKRRKAAAADSSEIDSGLDDLESFADEIADEAAIESNEAADALADDIDAATEAESEFDSEATMVLDSPEEMNPADATTTMEAEEDRDDVIAEADVYLAYGIYQQAEDLLTQAIADNPERDDYRVKLAETHYASKNADAFVDVASELHKQVDNDASPAWKKVMVMGQDLCADNPLFQGSLIGGLDVGSLAPSTPEMDFDLGADSGAEGGAPDLDLSLDDDALELPEMADAEPGSEPVDELEFDLSDTGAVDALVTDAEDEFSLDIDATELDIDNVEKAEESLDLGDMDLGLDLSADESATDIGDVDLDFGLDEIETVAETTVDEEEISLDLTDDVESLDIDMGLDDTEAAVSAVSAESIGSAESIIDDDAEFDLSNLDDVDEISTKLDLARAYLDMGDHDGSRGILEEVLAEGNDEQKQEANDLIAKLD